MSLQLKPFAMMSSTQVTEGAAGLQLSLCTAPRAQPPCAADPLQPSTNSWQTVASVSPQVLGHFKEYCPNSMVPC